MIGGIILLLAIVLVLWLRIGRLEARVSKLEQPTARVAWHVGTPMEE